MKKKYSVYGMVSAVTANEEIEAESEEEAKRIFREMWVMEELYEKDQELEEVYVEEVA